LPATLYYDIFMLYIEAATFNKTLKMMKTRITFNIAVLLSSLFVFVACQQQETAKKELSRAFEMRFISDDPNANGETDFKGETEVFDTEQRVAYLKNWANYGKRFFKDSTLSTKILSDEEVENTANNIKPQPNPEVRRVIALNDWKFLGYRPGQSQSETRLINAWDQMEGASVRDQALHLSPGHYSKSIQPQSWRMALSWEVKSPSDPQNVTFSLNNGVEVGLTDSGKFFYVEDGKEIAAGNYSGDQSYRLKVEVDLEYDRYNFYVDNQLVADFVRLSTPIEKVEAFNIESGSEIVIDNIWGVGFVIKELESRTHPYLINTFIDEDFSAPQDPEGFQFYDFDDGAWPVVPYERYAHGGERQKEEALYLRKQFNIDAFERAVLNIETVRPAAEIYINGELVKEVGRHPEQIDVSTYLKENSENLIAVKVHPYAVDVVQYHMSTDKWAGWFAGLMDLELTGESFINHVFAHTTSIDDPAVVNIAVESGNVSGEDFTGRLVARFYKWHPEESESVAAEATTDINIPSGEEQLHNFQVKVPAPDLWSSDTPNLYKVHITMIDDAGDPVDDYVLTTGLRTISQDGGTFRINGNPEMMNGPLVFNQAYPLENVSKWMFSPPMSYWVENVLMVKKMNGNAIRMSVHDRTYAGINDRRLAEIGDQLGIMFLWQTPTWIRTHWPEDFDFEGLPKYVCALHNNPSIVIWQVGNHPTFHMDWFEQVYNTIYEVDQSRLIAPTADIARMKGDFKHPKSDSSVAHDLDDTYPSWRGKMVARGNMEQTTAYGRTWDKIRKFPERFEEITNEYIPSDIRLSYLNSPTHAFFDYESEETIAQPNWDVMKGKPYYHLYSYEKDYDVGSIGRVLTFDEWQESQAWQALTIYEAYRKKRWLDYDGTNWCPLRGGPNTATYKKPIVDYHGHAKLGYHAMGMVYQDVLAGSKNLDIVYGPDDEIPVMVLNLGAERTVDVLVMVKNVEGAKLDEKLFERIQLKDGRTVTDLGNWKPAVEPGQHYGIEYVVLE